MTPRSDDNADTPETGASATEALNENKSLTGDAADAEHPAGDSHAASNSDKEPAA